MIMSFYNAFCRISCFVVVLGYMYMIDVMGVPSGNQRAILDKKPKYVMCFVNDGEKWINFSDESIEQSNLRNLTEINATVILPDHNIYETKMLYSNYCYFSFKKGTQVVESVRQFNNNDKTEIYAKKFYPGLITAPKNIIKSFGDEFCKIIENTITLDTFECKIENCINKIIDTETYKSGKEIILGFCIYRGKGELLYLGIVIQGIDFSKKGDLNLFALNIGKIEHNVKICNKENHAK